MDGCERLKPRTYDGSAKTPHQNPKRRFECHNPALNLFADRIESGLTSDCIECPFVTGHQQIAIVFVERPVKEVFTWVYA